MTWQYRIGRKDGVYSVFEYITDDGGKSHSWTKDSIIDRWYESPKELKEDLEMMLNDIKNLDYFDYE